MSTLPHLDLAAWLLDNDVEILGEQIASLRVDLISSDTRNLSKGDVYLPLRGEHFDGHHFIFQAFAAGAQRAFCERAYYQAHQNELKAFNLILVENSLKALHTLARAWRSQLGIPVIAITGSSGKTSTKEILAQVLSPFFEVHRTAQNYNNEIGVPKTLIELRPEHDICILEMGMRGLEQIQVLCEIAAPDYGIISNIGPVHLSELGTQENIAQAKWELAEWLTQHQGILAINAENTYLTNLAEKYTGQIYRCGKQAGADLRLISCKPHAQEQEIFYSLPDGTQNSVRLDLQGEHQALNLLTCLAILYALGKRLPEGHTLHIPRLFGRQEQYILPSGPTLIHDAYNANPDSMRAALKVLQQTEGQRIAVLGKMAELGPEAERFHFELGQFCDSLHLEHVYIIGSEAKAILDGLQAVPGTYLRDNQTASALLPSLLENASTVLFKASRSAGLEEVVNTLVSHYSRLAK